MLLVCVTSLIFLFCANADASITWTAPPPQHGPIAQGVTKTRRTNQTLIKGSSNQHLTWGFTLSGQTLDRVAFYIQTDNIRIGRKTDGGILLQNHADRFNISASDPATLIIYKVTEADEDIFRCEVETEQGAVWSDEIQVKVVDPPIATLQQCYTPVTEGDNVTLNCNATGSPTPKIAWIRTSTGNILSNKKVYMITAIKRSESGSYKCLAWNGIGNNSTKSCRIDVEFPPEIKLQNKSYVGRKKSVSLHCQVEGYPPPTITWTPCNPQKNVCDKSRLNVSEVQRDAVYNCIVYNTLGNDSASTSLIIGAKKINLTFSITSEEIKCTEVDASFWEKLRKPVDKIFTNYDGYVGATLLKTRCGSLIVDLALEFTSVVSEASVLSTLRNGLINGKLGEFTVNASSIVGIQVIESTATPPTVITTTKPSDDKNIGLIVGASVGGFILLVIIIAVVIWCVRKKNTNDKDKKKKSKTSNKEVGDNDAEGHQMSRFQGGRPTSGHGNNGYENAGSIPGPPAANAGKKGKKEKKGQAEEDKPVGVVYAQVDKDKRTRKPKEPENLYDQAARPNSKTPGQLQYISPEDLQQGRQSMPRNSGTEPRKPEAYTETEYAVLV